MYYYVLRVRVDYASHNASSPKFLAIIRKQNKNKHIANEQEKIYFVIFYVQIEEREENQTHIHVHTSKVCV